MKPLSSLSIAQKSIAFSLLLATALLSQAQGEMAEPGRLRIGWARADITPEGPVAMRGGTTSIGVMDPLTATALALQSGENENYREGGVILVSCDLLYIPDGSRSDVDLRGEVRKRVVALLPDVRPEQVVLMATHTHVAPTVRPGAILEFLAERIAIAAASAWENRQPGGVSFGLGHAVIGHHRIVTHKDGSSRMVGSFQKGKVADPDFNHLEGFEDHSVHLLYTWDESRRLTGVLVNVPCPAQVQRGDRLSADFWHETRTELSERLGPEVHLFPQLSAAGDIANIVMVEARAEARMQQLLFPDLSDPRLLRRKQIAVRIADAVTSVLPHMGTVVETHPRFGHRVAEVALPGGFPDPDPASPELLVEVHALRLSEVAMVTNPFELYLDYGVRIKGRSPAVQTFVAQLAGGGSYLPTIRAVAGGGYGAIAETCVVGPAAGDRLVEASLDLIGELWTP